jgi:hypothetical protein
VRLPMPVEVKLRPIHEDMLEVAQLFQQRHFARWIVGTGADFYGPIYREFEPACFMRTSICQQVHVRSVSATKPVPRAHSPGGVYLRTMA